MGKKVFVVVVVGVVEEGDRQSVVVVWMVVVVDIQGRWVLNVEGIVVAVVE